MSGATLAGRGLRVIVVLAVAGGLFWAATRAHLRMACMILDTPYLPLCPAPSSKEEQQSRLLERIRRDPGDSEAWVQLLTLEDPRRKEQALAGAVALAPGDPNVLTRHAVAALQAGHLPEAVALLVDNVRFRGDGASARALAQILATTDGTKLLEPHLASASEWLPGVVGAMGVAKTPAPLALPLVMEAQQKGRFPDAAWSSYMRALKTGGYWVDAYGLWLASRKDPVPLLYNGSFDEAFEPDGFDWEFNLQPRSRAGVLIEQQPLARRGMVLDLEFTGRSFPTPILRQYVFAAPGTYRLQGEYMASSFHSDQGLVWSVVCVAGHQAVAGRSEPMQDTGGVWKRVEVAFTVPPDCGPVASIQLEPAAAVEASTGLRGEVALDAYSLTHALPEGR